MQQVKVEAPGGTATIPCSVEFEQEAVGVAFTYQHHAEVLFDALTVEDFFSDVTRRHWSAMLSIHARGEVVDKAAIQRVMGDRCELVFLMSVSRGIPIGVNVESIIRTLREFTQKRGIVSLAERALNEAILGTQPVGDQLEQAREGIERLFNERAGETGPETADVIVGRLLAAQDEPPPCGLSSGIADLDALIGRRGFAGGDLVIAAARTGVGKSVFACQVAAHAVLRRQARTLFVTLEITADSILERMAISESRVSATDVRDRSLSEADQVSYAGALGRFRDAPLHVDDRPATVQRVRRIARRLHRRHGLGLVVVDYLQRLNSTPGDKFESRALEVGRWTKALKDLALELKVPILVLAQLNRETVKLNSLPQLHHLKESGSIEQDSDSVILIHRIERDDATEGPGPKPGDDAWLPSEQARLILAKHREGPTGTVTVRWSGEHQRFDILSSWREGVA